MKVTRKDTPKEFSPVTLELTIESESELRTLYTILNLSDEEVLDSSSRTNFEVRNANELASLMKFYIAVTKICEERL